MKHFKYLGLIMISVLVLNACNKKIESYQANPNSPTSVPPDLILGTVLTDMSGTGSAGNLGGINSWGEVAQWDQYHCQNYNYYGNNIYSWGSGSFDPYLVLKNVVQMQKEVTSRGGNAVNPYESVGRFAAAYYYYNLTSMFGDVPQAEALNTANSTPAYTPQEQVFAFVLNELDSANSDFASLIAANDNSLSPSQDFFYGGSLTAWQKLVNTFKLRVLIALSGKAADATLNVATQFANIFNNPTTYPVFTSTGDDMQFIYNPG